MSRTLVERLARYLSAGEIRSAEAIAFELGCSRGLVSELVESLRHSGMEIDVVAGQGYLLRETLEFLDKDLIIHSVDPAVRKNLETLIIEDTVDSTNSALQRLTVVQQHATVILAEHQSKGRGQRGRTWHSPFARNVYLSLGWTFEQTLSTLGCLPLVVALATAQALARAGLEGHRVKWPNDLLLGGRKLGGCLVEIQGDKSGPCHAVLGVGINVRMPVSGQTAGIDQPWTDLNSQLPDYSRNKLVAMLLEDLFRQLQIFAEQGFEPFQESWQQLDGLIGQFIRVNSGSQILEGTANGIDNSGALLLDTGEERLRLYSGQVSLHKLPIG